MVLFVVNPQIARLLGILSLLLIVGFFAGAIFYNGSSVNGENLPFLR
jgi:hypothetical protein